MLFLFVAGYTVVIKLDYGVIWNSYVYVFDWVFDWFLLHEFWTAFSGMKHCYEGLRIESNIPYPKNLGFVDFSSMPNQTLQFGDF